ncbi:MAG: Gfo/Idh/MocA family oxidoreductase [Planctomycetes bacterium]|nr:Gfo/Idh/MocA family oxidoreductase [Planctomycetota bacterium]
MQPLRVAVVGVGHLGKEHARIYHDMPGVRLVGVYDTHPGRAQSVSRACDAPVLRDLDEVLASVEAASVVVPTVDHFAVARRFLERGLPVLVEKPLAPTLAEAAELVRISRRHEALLQVGHVERFNPAVVALQERVHAPQFIECHRLGAFSFRSCDVDVVLDLMIHDLDILHSLIEAPVRKVEAFGAAILTEHADFADVRLTFEDGCVANLTASRVSPRAVRKIRVLTQDSLHTVDCMGRRLRTWRRAPGFGKDGLSIASINPSTLPDLKAFVFGKLLQAEEVHLDPKAEPLKRELESFVRCVREGSEPVVPGEQGRRAVETALRIRAAMRRSARRRVRT